MPRLIFSAFVVLLAGAPAYAQILDLPQDGANPGYQQETTPETVIPAPQDEPAAPVAPAPQTPMVPSFDDSSDVQEVVIPGGTRYEAKPSILSLQAGLGVTDYRGELNNNIDTGLSWDLRGSIRNDKLLGAELAYTGAANGTSFEDDDLGANVDNTAVSSIGDAQARVNLTNRDALQPYLAAGLGFLTLDVRDRNSTVDEGTALTLPLSAGLQVYTKSPVTFGGRFNYRVLTDVVSNDLPSGDQWNVGVNVGAVF